MKGLMYKERMLQVIGLIYNKLEIEISKCESYDEFKYRLKEVMKKQGHIIEYPTEPWKTIGFLGESLYELYEVGRNQHLLMIWRNQLEGYVV